MAADWQVPVLQTAAQTAPAADNQYWRATSRPPVTGEPQEVPQVAIPATQQTGLDTEAPQEVPKVDVHPRTARMQLAPKDDRATALRDRRLAEYEARLHRSQARPMVHASLGTTIGMGLMRGAGPGYLLHPGWASRPTRQATDIMDSL